MNDWPNIMPECHRIYYITYYISKIDCSVLFLRSLYLLCVVVLFFLSLYCSCCCCCLLLYFLMLDFLQTPNKKRVRMLEFINLFCWIVRTSMNFPIEYCRESLMNSMYKLVTVHARCVCAFVLCMKHHQTKQTFLFIQMITIKIFF